VLELSLDFGSGEVAAEGGVVNVVVVGELAERFAGGPASNRRRVGDEPARSRSRLGRERGLWQLERVVGEGPGEDGRVDRAAAPTGPLSIVAVLDVRFEMSN
jgi:hypothetical protein